jgi:hypothetical protein
MNKINTIFNLVILLSYYLNYESNDYYDTSPYWLINDNLYTNDSNELYFQTFNLSEGKSKVIYLKRFLFDQGRNNLEKKLSEIIHAESWMQISRHMYRDKNNLYCFQPQSTGGFLVHLEDINPENLLFLNKNNKWLSYKQSLNLFEKRLDGELSLYSSYGSDIYYICSALEDVNKSKFQLIDGKASFARDDKFEYIGNIKQ